LNTQKSGVGVGVIGAGIMGADHAAILSRHVTGAHLAALCDADSERANRVAAECHAGKIYKDPAELIGEPEVQAVVIASPDHTHADLVLACLEADKPVLCEKPLASNPGECQHVVRAEMKHGRRMIQVGYMRRFDPTYQDMKRAMMRKGMGRPLVLHCIHRNPAAPGTTSDSVLASGAVHEIDIARWLLGGEIVHAQTWSPIPGGEDAVRDPQLVLLRSNTGALITIEMFENAGYGYEVRAEAVCEKGTVSLEAPADVRVRYAGSDSSEYPSDWRPRFALSYRNQLQAWVDGIVNGTSCGADAWDGYLATTIAHACIRSLKTGQGVEIKAETRPEFYR